jgi:hypothetical protein
VRKVSSGNGFSLNELLALEADDGQGNKEEEEEEEGDGSDASDYVEIEDEDIFNETTLQLPPKCHLHPVGTLRIQGKADWALPLAEAILKTAADFHADKKIAPRLRSAVEKLWDKAPVRKELTEKMEAMIVDWDEEASMKGKHKSRRLSMEQYVQEAWMNGPLALCKGPRPTSTSRRGPTALLCRCSTFSAANSPTKPSC